MQTVLVEMLNHITYINEFPTVYTILYINIAAMTRPMYETVRCRVCTRCERTLSHCIPAQHFTFYHIWKWMHNNKTKRSSTIRCQLYQCGMCVRCQTGLGMLRCQSWMNTSSLGCDCVFFVLCFICIIYALFVEVVKISDMWWLLWLHFTNSKLIIIIINDKLMYE